MRPAFGLALALALVLPHRSVADPTPVQQCLSCHLYQGQLNIVGVDALNHLPETWPLMYADPDDRDGDGIAGRVSFVSGGGTPLIGKWGRNLAAAHLADFAKIAGAAHDIPLDGALDQIEAAFERLSPQPSATAFATPQLRQRFNARGCAGCHVTASFAYQGRDITPLSDFLLHDLGYGERRTTPLWYCDADCLARAHTELPGADTRPQ
ncbi:MAG: hypothetical protein AAFR93_14800 [Pseudomonadota bacterium]